MPDYLDLYNLELTSSSYSAKFIEKSLEDLPSECKLPSAAPLPELPPLDITLPSLLCRYDIDQPIIPPPYFCTPSVSGSFGVVISSASIGSATGGAEITRVVNSDCDYALAGGITIYLPEVLTSPPCTPVIAIAATGTGSNSLGGPPVVNVDFANDLTDSCHPSIQFNVDVTMDVCTDMQFQLIPAGPLIIDILEGVDQLSIGSLSASMELSWNLENDCAPELIASWASDAVITITLPDNSCCSSIGLDVNSSLPSASMMGTVYNQSSASIGNLDIAFALSVGTGSTDSCTPKLFLDWTQLSCSATISLDSSSSTTCCESSFILTVCQDGDILEYTVFGYLNS